jgi:hypothetical protein
MVLETTKQIVGKSIYENSLNFYFLSLDIEDYDNSDEQNIEKIYCETIKRLQFGKYRLFNSKNHQIDFDL